MYRQHFNLEKKPFQISSDHEFLWLGKKHSTALELLKRGITERQGLLVLIGDVGTGKTTLINEIIHTLDADTLFAKIVDPCFEKYHLFLAIAQSFGFEDQYKEGGNFLSAFFSFLKTADKNGRKALVIIDEAQRIPEWFLKEIISWCALDLNKVLTVILAGQLEFKGVLKTSLGPSWKDNITIYAFLEPLNEEETQTYINKRLELAGADRKIFLAPAVHEIFGYSKGTPRLINISCDQGLIAAFAKGMNVIDAPTIRRELSQLNLPAVRSKNQAINKDRQPLKDNRINHGFRFFKKKLSRIAMAACICFYIGYPVSTENTPFVMDIQKPVDPKPIITDTPAPFSENKESSLPVLVGGKTKDSETIEIEEEEETEEKALLQPALSFQNMNGEDYPVSSIEPEPDAIIDWLFETRKRDKKE